MKPNTDTTSNARFTDATVLAEGRTYDEGHPRRRQHRRSVVVALALLRGYKLIFSPYFAGSCRFLPSCADYAREAVIRHGVLYGGWFAATRIARCHPLCDAGHDPVPVHKPAPFKTLTEWIAMHRRVGVNSRG